MSNGSDALLFWWGVVIGGLVVSLAYTVAIWLIGGARRER